MADRSVIAEATFAEFRKTYLETSADIGDIHTLGNSFSGIPIYEFNYRGEKGRFRGVLAQDVPHATTIHKATGYKMVDYSKVFNYGN